MSMFEVGPGGHLLTQANLADVANKPVALQNLGIADVNGIQVGQVVATSNGPGTNTSYASGSTTVFSVAAALVNGQKYMVTLDCNQAQQITNAATGTVQVGATDSLSLLPGGSVRAFLTTALPLSSFISGSGVALITATSTASDTFSVFVMTSNNSLSIPAFGITLIVTRAA